MTRLNVTPLRKTPPEAELKNDHSPLVPLLFTLVVAFVAACFGSSLYRWVKFALQSDLYSYILLVPAISLYLLRMQIDGPRFKAGTSRELVLGIILLGGAAIGIIGLIRMSDTALGVQDAIAFSTFSFILLIGGACAVFFERGFLRRAAFPLLFLVFMAPIPLGLEQALETFLQRGSAPPAFWFLKLAGTPVFREDLIFQLPGITLHIAPECSGIRSTIVLFMTSLVAGHLFLRSNWKKAILMFAVIPLALLRNGFRVFVIGQLCVNIGPHMIDSAIHHYGGTIFFALSLIPFSILTYFLVKSDRSKSGSKVQPIAP